MVPDFIFTISNAAGLLGWTLVLLALLSRSTTLLSDHTDALFEAVPPFGRVPIIDSLYLLEVVCFAEVGRIAAGQLKGNLVLGMVLHSIRVACIRLVLSDGLMAGSGGVGFDNLLSTLVLYSWSLTEVGRYPMYLFPSSATARRVRLALPLLTFPIGAAAEALGAYRAARKILKSGAGEEGQYGDYAALGLLGMVVVVNGVLGPTMAYPALLKKGLPALMGRAERKKGTKAD
mmetsp:Transcript_50303/g.107129  ORF Transcript_50303/g.107129 Transcript_50303/m.107129 type:complete len:232 (+) Transcript_50303:121-816(+)